MLYISRFVGYDHYGVVDTDDGIETIVSLSELRDIVCVQRIGICGVISDGSALRENMVFIYQPQHTRSKLQIKTRVLKGIDIKVFGTMITSITLDEVSNDNIVDIRLSDFGDACADFVLTRNTPNAGYRLNLILDDKVRYSPFAFCRRYYTSFANRGGIGVVFDMRECSDLVAEQLYRMIRNDRNEMLGSIFDKAERMDRLTQNHAEV